MKHIRFLALATALLLISVSVCARCENPCEIRNCADRENCGLADRHTLPCAQFGDQSFYVFRFSCPTADSRRTAKPFRDQTPSADADPQMEQPASKPEPSDPEPNGTEMTSMESELIRQVNAERAKNGLGALKVSSALMRAAKARGMEIVSLFSHTRPDGSSWSTVSDAARGENIAKGQQTVDKVMAAWMSSSGHRANILRSSFGSIGVCAYRQGNVMYWVQLFGQ